MFEHAVYLAFFLLITLSSTVTVPHANSEELLNVMGGTNWQCLMTDYL
jgi:hypothetical protein